MKTKSLIYVLANSFAMLMSILIAYFNQLTQGNKYNNILVVLLFSIILIPSNLNVFRLTKKKIYNGAYNVILLCTSLYSCMISTYSILLYYAKYFEDGGKSSSIFFQNHIIVIIALILFTFISTFFTEKEIIKTKVDNTGGYLFLILLTSILPFFSHVKTFTLIANVLLIVLTIKTMIGLKGVFSNDNVRMSYFGIFVLSLISGNIVSAIISCFMFIDLDIIGVNV